METKVITKIISDIEDLKFGFWDEKKELFIELDPENLVSISKALDCSTELVTSLGVFSESLKELVKSDLVDIWKRLSEIDRKVKRLHDKTET
jgi:hypothetical protein